MSLTAPFIFDGPLPPEEVSGRDRLGLSKGGARGALGALVGRGDARDVEGTIRLVDPLYAEWVRRRS